VSPWNWYEGSGIFHRGPSIVAGQSVAEEEIDSVPNQLDIVFRMHQPQPEGNESGVL